MNNNMNSKYFAIYGVSGKSYILLHNIIKQRVSSQDVDWSSILESQTQLILTRFLT